MRQRKGDPDGQMQANERLDGSCRLLASFSGRSPQEACATRREAQRQSQRADEREGEHDGGSDGSTEGRATSDTAQWQMRSRGCVLATTQRSTMQRSASALPVCHSALGR